MIALHFMQYLQNNGIGTIEDDLWYGQLPLGDRYQPDGDELAVIEVGGQLRKKGNCIQELEVWGRACNGRWPQMAKRLASIVGLLKEDCCPELPSIAVGCCTEPAHTYEYVFIRPIGNVENLGVDDENNMLYRIRVEITYK